MISKLEEGERLFSEGKICEAENCFLKIIKNDIFSKEAFNNLGVISHQKGALDLARTYFRQALEIDPGYREAIDNLAVIGLNRNTTTGNIPERVEDKRRITGHRIAIVNSFGNKFNELYTSYFGEFNDIRVIQPKTKDDILGLDSVLDWADIVYSTWANEPLIYLSRRKSDTLLITNIRSYEIFFDESFESIKWDNVDGVIFVADHVRHVAREKWKSRLASIPQTTIYNCVELDKYPFYEKSPGNNIAYIGYLNAKKGVELLLQCIRAAVDINPDYHFHIAGEFQGERFRYYTEHLLAESNLGEHVTFHGWVDNTTAFLKDMNYVISTSPWEGCPNNIIEAMACGVKPLIHNWPGAGEIFPLELTFNTVGRFCDLLSSPDYNSKSYREYVAANFNAAIQLPVIESFISSLLRKKPEGQKPISTGHTLCMTGKREIVDDLSGQREDAQSVEGGVNFLQPLPVKVEIVDNRKGFTVDFCRGKKVLHIGCVDAGMMKKRISGNSYLHYQINDVAEKLIGIDIDGSGIEFLRNEGYEVEQLNIEYDRERLTLLSQDIDVIVIPEVIEHLNNVGRFLENLHGSGFDGDILISTPNSFSYRVTRLLSEGIELVHPDHNCYYSPTTLTTLLTKHNFEIKRLLMYYWPTSDDFGREFEKVLAKSPYLAEGIIAIIRKV